MAIGIFANSLIGRWLSYPLIQAGGRIASIFGVIQHLPLGVEGIHIFELNWICVEFNGHPLEIALVLLKRTAVAILSARESDVFSKVSALMVFISFTLFVQVK